MIEYLGQEYWSKQIEISGRGVVTVSSTDLNAVLTGDIECGDEEKAKVALAVDNQIALYIDEQKQEMSTEMLVKYVSNFL